MLELRPVYNICCSVFAIIDIKCLALYGFLMFAIIDVFYVIEKKTKITGTMKSYG